MTLTMEKCSLISPHLNSLTKTSELDLSQAPPISMKLVMDANLISLAVWASLNRAWTMATTLSTKELPAILINREMSLRQERPLRTNSKERESQLRRKPREIDEKVAFPYSSLTVLTTNHNINTLIIYKYQCRSSHQNYRYFIFINYFFKFLDFLNFAYQS